MSKILTINNNFEFKRVYNRGTYLTTPFLVVYIIKNRNKQSRIGITASTKVGNAVFRNRFRRRIKEIYRNCRVSDGYDIVIVARKNAIYASFIQIEKSIYYTFYKLGIMSK